MDGDLRRHNDVVLTSLNVYLFTMPVSLVYAKLWGLAMKKLILIENLHNSSWNSPRDFFNDILSTACELTMLILSMSVTLNVTCETVASLIMKSCQQRWPIHY